MTFEKGIDANKTHSKSILSFQIEVFQHLLFATNKIEYNWLERPICYYNIGFSDTKVSNLGPPV